MERTVHSEFVELFKESGLEEIAENFSLMKDGSIGGLVDNDVPLKRKQTSSSDGSKGSSKRSKKSKDAHIGESYFSTEWRDVGEKNWTNEIAPYVFQALKHKRQCDMSELIEAVVDDFIGTESANNSLDSSADKNVVQTKVRDTVSVLSAMEIIESRADGSLRWIGFPANSTQVLDILREERNGVAEKIRNKYERLQNLITQIVSTKNLVERNKNQTDQTRNDQRIPLPFIVISTNKNTNIEIEMAECQTDVFLNLNQPFRIHDDSEIFKGMNLDKTDMETLKSLLPKELMPFVPKNIVESQTKENAA